MSDTDIPSSGSRWESADGAAETVPEPEFLTVAVAGDAVALASSRRRPRRSPLAVAGVGLVLAGGLGGFAVGHALTGPDGTEPGLPTDADPDGTSDGPPDDSNSSPGDDEGGTS